MRIVSNDDGMPLDPSFGEQIIGGFARVRSDPAFRTNHWWLTFYLTSEPKRLDAVARQLSSLGGENLDGTGGGWLYAKVPVYPDLESIKSAAAQVAAICDARGAWLSSIDADTSAEVAQSCFEELYQSESPPNG